MYRPYFGLNDLPFKTTPDLQMFYKHGTRQEILDALLYTVERGDGIIKVTGEVGSGKTMLLRLLASRLDNRFEIVYINSPNLSAKDLLLYICSELGLAIDSNSAKFDIVNLLKRHLVELHAKNKNVVMLVDEAQSMTFDALEEVRLLSNLETSDHKLLQIVLFGQPELDVAVEHPDVRQLKSRITYSIYVRPLNYQEVRAYLNYRLRKVGYQGLDLFDDRVAKKICRLSDGLPRTINVIADKALMAAFSQGDKSIKLQHVKADSEEFFNGSSFNYFYIFIGFISVVLISLAYLSLPKETNLFGFLPSSTIDSANMSSINDTGVKDLADPIKTHKNVDSIGTDLPTKGLQASNTTQVVATVKEASALEEETLVAKVPVKDVSLKLNTSFSALPKAYVSKLLNAHTETAKWLQETESNYTIQLSTRTIDSLNSALRFYQRVLGESGTVRAVIDYHQQSQSFRIKFFYLDALSVSGISSNIELLPKAVARSKPFVAPISALRRNLSYTEQKLIEVGVPYE